tara:strand:- start:2383 stop:3093 length:711 start_codon:yes stop_codon:yes gene_type:complete
MTKSRRNNTSARLFSARGGFLLLTLGALVVGMSACAKGGAGHRRDESGRRIPNERDIDPAGTQYSDTMDKAASGDCSVEIVAVLTCYAYRGHGYEGAQTALGLCQTQNKNAADGVTWLSRAANSGWPDAQKALVGIYLKGEGVDTDRVEAGKWAQLYRKNPSLLSLGVQPDKKIAEQIREELTQSERIEASLKADQWNADFWKPQTALDARTAAICYVAPRRTRDQGTIMNTTETY